MQLLNASLRKQLHEVLVALPQPGCHVRGVPKTIINETVHVEGAVPEALLMSQLIPFLEVTA
jgi:hypothetical protein